MIVRQGKLIGWGGGKGDIRLSENFGFAIAVITWETKQWKSNIKRSTRFIAVYPMTYLYCVSRVAIFGPKIKSDLMGFVRHGEKNAQLYHFICSETTVCCRDVKFLGLPKRSDRWFSVIRYKDSISKRRRSEVQRSAPRYMFVLKNTPCTNDFSGTRCHLINNNTSFYKCVYYLQCYLSEVNLSLVNDNYRYHKLSGFV